MIYVDTSAFYALASSSDKNHARATAVLEKILASGEGMTTTSYVVSETWGLLQHRLGLSAARSFSRDVLPAIRVVWVNEALHRAGVAVWKRLSLRSANLVDCVGIALLQGLGDTRAFAYDSDFTRAGFRLP
ncbi:MAG: PIN domain-containing protein [Planctomycetes bacterium]|nr:PIN domain-containing protein [Planctomycetota bacterium]